MTDVWGEPVKGSVWLGMLNPQPWVEGALCAQVGGDDLWFPEKGGNVIEAKMVCAACEVQPECLAWALETGDMNGIIGGYSPRERIKLRRGETLPVTLEDRARAVEERREARGMKRDAA